MKNLRVSSDPVADLAGQLEIAAREAIAARGRFSLALSGGSTPRALYELLATPDWNRRFEWEKCAMFFGDERAVAPDDALSNFKMANEALLSRIPAPTFRIETEYDDLEAVAARYETQLRTLGNPLDLVLLGLGDDGHTASLFPHSPQLNETEKWVTATPVASMEPRVRRLTLTFPALNAARFAWFLVSGAGKAKRVAEVLNGARDVQRLPSQGVAPQDGESVWFLDEGAARDISQG